MLFNQAMDIFTLPTLKKAFIHLVKKRFLTYNFYIQSYSRAQHTYTIDYCHDYNTAKFSKQGLYK